MKNRERTFNPTVAVVACMAVLLSLAKGVYADTVYTTTNAAGPNAVAAFNLEPKTGTLTFQGLYPTGGIGNPNTVRASQAAMITDRDFLYVVNPGSNDISVFRIEDDGSLELTGPPTPSGGLQPVSLAISQHGILFVANQGNSQVPGNYTGFRSKSGLLEPIPGSTIELTTTGKPSQVLFSRDGKLLMGARPGDSTIDEFAVTKYGEISRRDLLPKQAGAFALAWNPAVHDQLLATLARLPGSASYSVSATGGVQFLSEAADPFATDPCWLVVRQDGRFLWLSGFFESGISLHAIGADGRLSFIDKHDTSSYGKFSTFLATDEDQRYLYELIPSTNSLHVMRFTGNTDNGGLSDLQTVTVPQGSNPIGLVVVSN